MARHCKTPLRTAWSALFAAALTACGGGSDTYPTTAQPQAIQQAPLTVLTLGDSTTTPVYPGERSVPGLLADATGWRVTNIGVSGTTACMADLPAIRSARAAVVTANYAINDSAFETLPHDRECWDAIAAATKDAGSVLVVIESNPIAPGGQWSYSRDDATRRQFEAQKQRFATDAGAYYCRLPAITWTLDQLPDGVHPGALVKPLIAARYADCIRRAL